LSARAIAATALVALGLLLAPAPPPARAGNGCGPAGFGALVPDRPLGFDFRAACDHHDACYTTPWRELAAGREAAKLECDTGFLADLDAACLDAAADRARHVGLCLQLALDYYRAVRSWLGDLAYARAQL
jgi:hypothetical protein